jgi:hypothetical protein
LTIAVSKPSESVFSKVFLIRTSVFQGTPGVSAANIDFSYPYAVEHEGQLYIGYTHKSHAASELAVIPVRSLVGQRHFSTLLQDVVQARPPSVHGMVHAWKSGAVQLEIKP